MIRTLRSAPALVTAAAALLGVAATFVEDDGPPPAPRVGASAPAFRVNDHEGDAVAVGGEADHWTVLAFYPKAMTPG